MLGSLEPIKQRICLHRVLYVGRILTCNVCDGESSTHLPVDFSFVSWEIFYIRKKNSDII